MKSLVWSLRAQRRLSEYAHSLAEYDYPETAVRWLQNVREAAEHLSEFPLVGRASPEFQEIRPRVRDITIGNYRLFYRVRRTCVEIISIHNCKQNITSLRSL